VELKSSPPETKRGMMTCGVHEKATARIACPTATKNQYKGKGVRIDDKLAALSMYAGESTGGRGAGEEARREKEDSKKYSYLKK